MLKTIITPVLLPSIRQFDQNASVKDHFDHFSQEERVWKCNELQRDR